MNHEQYLKIIEWATSEHSGVSSISICRYMLNLNPTNKVYFAPSDKSDRTRCRRLLATIPEWWDRLDEMKRFNKDWSEQVELIKSEKELPLILN
jgi:hypothetical protein